MNDRYALGRRRLRRRTVLSLAVALNGTGAAVLAQTATDTSADTLQEVIVTATRHEESIQKVPISVQAFSQEQMDAQGVKQIDDLVRFTPGLSLTRNSTTGANQIAIR